MRRSWIALLAVAVLLASAGARAAAVSPERVEALERRNAELEVHNQDLERRLESLEQRDRERARQDDERDLGAPLADWARRIRIGGSANTGYYRGGDESPFEDTSFQVWDARFFLDAFATLDSETAFPAGLGLLIDGFRGWLAAPGTAPGVGSR